MQEVRQPLLWPARSAPLMQSATSSPNTNTTANRDGTEHEHDLRRPLVRANATPDLVKLGRPPRSRSLDYAVTGSGAEGVGGEQAHAGMVARRAVAVGSLFRNGRHLAGPAPRAHGRAR
jgi:hypothetical protein